MTIATHLNLPNGITYGGNIRELNRQTYSGRFETAVPYGRGMGETLYTVVGYLIITFAPTRIRTIHVTAM